MSTAKTIEAKNIHREKRMNDESLATRILDWLLVRLPALPVATAIIFLYIYQEYPVKKDWQRLKNGDKVVIITVSVIAFLGGLTSLVTGLKYTFAG
jgi:uncharacterized membrane protein YjfL (UPF0719 family)